MKKNYGFTLVEVLLATVILAIGLIGTSAFFYANRRNLYNARLERYATWSAIEKMEMIKGLDYDAIEEGPPKDEDIGDRDNPITATVTTTIAPVEENGISYKSVNVTVSWPQGENNKEVSLSTYIFDL
jgi:prepilin-type N-terminal cleavage/methylation domain-containing protein